MCRYQSLSKRIFLLLAVLYDLSEWLIVLTGTKKVSYAYIKYNLYWKEVVKKNWKTCGSKIQKQQQQRASFLQKISIKFLLKSETLQQIQNLFKM